MTSVCSNELVCMVDKMRREVYAADINIWTGWCMLHDRYCSNGILDYGTYSLHVVPPPPTCPLHVRHSEDPA
jgi:hypothetical protein